MYTIVLYMIICIGKKKNSSIFYEYMYVNAQEKIWKNTNWKYTGGRVGKVNRDISFNANVNVLIIIRKIFTYYLANKN